MITPRAVVIGSALPALVLVTLVVVPGARSAVGLDSRAPAAVAPLVAGPTASPLESAEEREAMRLLRRSVRAGATLGFSGTQIVTAWHDEGTTTEMLDVVQQKGGGRTVEVRDVADGTHGERLVNQSPVGDGSAGPAHRALDALGAAWDLRPAGHDEVAGREATEVVASRGGHVGARIWLDDETGLQLRQDVLDDAGRLHRMSTYLELKVGAPATAAAQPPAATGWSRVAELKGWRDQGFPCPETLPAGYRLLDVRSDGPVLQLIYGDGLSAVSVFLQTGTLAGDHLAGLTKVDQGDGVFYEKRGWPELMVWQSGRTVITAVGDAEPADLRAALSAFPRPRSGGPEGGVLGSLHNAMGSAVAWFTG